MLETLILCKADIVGVITKQQSAFNSDFVDLSGVCIENDMDFLYVNNINDESGINYIRNKKPDLIYCFGWSQLLSDEIINIPSKGVVGFHPANLPQNRGRHPIVWALALGLTKTASTFFFITKGTDDGDIISQIMVPINLEDNAATLYQKILNVANEQVKEMTDKFTRGDIETIVQDNTKANYWRKRTEKDGEIDWRMSSITIYNLIRALTKPYVGAHFIYKDKNYKVWAAKISGINEHENTRYENIEYGKVVRVYSETSFLIKTGDGLLLIDNCEAISLNEGEYLL